MIKLVAADMDGTLLDSQKKLPPHFERVVEALAQRGVRFCAASGRQYYNLLENFEGFSQELLYICENGAMVCDGQGALYTDEIAKQSIYDIVSLARSIPQAYVILCGEKSAYLEADDEHLRQNADLYYARLTRVEDVLQAAQQDKICKIAVFQYQQAETGIYPVLAQLHTQFQVVLSGDCWVDVMNLGMNKGNGMRRLQKMLQLTPKECMAFGDYPNDCEMMDEIYYSYAMANAHPALRARCRFTAPSNDEAGVMQILTAQFALSLEAEKK